MYIRPNGAQSLCWFNGVWGGCLSLVWGLLPAPWGRPHQMGTPEGPQGGRAAPPVVGLGWGMCWPFRVRVPSAGGIFSLLLFCKEAGSHFPPLFMAQGREGPADVASGRPSAGLLALGWVEEGGEASGPGVLGAFGGPQRQAARGGPHAVLHSFPPWLARSLVHVPTCAGPDENAQSLPCHQGGHRAGRRCVTGTQGSCLSTPSQRSSGH